MGMLEMFRFIIVYIFSLDFSLDFYFYYFYSLTVKVSYAPHFGKKSLQMPHYYRTLRCHHHK